MPRTGPPFRPPLDVAVLPMKTPTALQSPDEFHAFVRSHGAAAVYFSGPDCHVCTALKPKLLELLDSDFPALTVVEVDCSVAPELAAQLTVFAIPTLIVFFDGAECLRKTRSFSLVELADELQRLYSLFFD